MSCCSKGYCDFKFPDGPPLLDNSVTNLQAKYQFLPYGTLLQKGEVVRLWMESGKTKTVMIEDKIPLEVLAKGFRPKAPMEAKMASEDSTSFSVDVQTLPWQLIAFDSGFDLDEMMHWKTHPLYNPSSEPVLMVYRQLPQPKSPLKTWWLGLLYKIRNI